MKRIHLEKYLYKGDLSEIETDIEFVLSNEDYDRYKPGMDIDSFQDARISADWILILERRCAARYFEINYPKALNGKYSPGAFEIRAIVELFGISRTQTASILGIDKTTLSNQINDKRKMERSTAFLLLERLGEELSRPGIIRAMVGETDISEIKESKEDSIMVQTIRYKHTKVA